MGDSVMLGCTKALRQRLGPRLTVDAAVSRQVEDLVERLRTYRANGVLPQTVIVQLGDNGPVWFRDLASLRSVLSKVPRVVLINARVDRSWQGEVLSEVGRFQRGWRQSRLAELVRPQQRLDALGRRPPGRERLPDLRRRGRHGAALVRLGVLAAGRRP